MRNDGVEDLSRHTIASSQNGRAEVWKKSRAGLGDLAR